MPPRRHRPYKWMNYYDELGIEQTSNAQEIRRAYRGLARLLHPDNFQDDERRRLAEVQMQHLNEILHTLTHPDEKLKYDEELRPLVLEEPIQEQWERPLTSKLRTASMHWFGILTATLFIAAGFWYWASGHNQPIVSAVTEQVPPSAPTPRQKKGSVPSGLAAGQPLAESKPTRQPAADQIVEQIAPDSQSTPSTAAEWSDPPPVEAPDGLPVAPVPLVNPAPTAPALNGLWLFVPPKSAPDSRNLYAPEYIELLILESNGKIIGKYTARYRIPDKPISPEVNFRLQGNAPATGAPLNLSWSSADGAEGEAALKHLTPNTLEVKWWTTRRGHARALASGESVLVRQQGR